MKKNYSFLSEIKTQEIFVAIVLFVFFAVTVSTSLFVYLDYPYVMDEYNYLFQANIFASGNLTLPSRNLPPSMTDLFVIYHEGQIFSKYPPLFSMILAIGVMIGLPFIVNPFVCLLFLILLYEIISRYTSRNISFCTIVIVASNPYFLGYASSYFAQPLSLLLTTLAFSVVSRIDKNSKNILYVLGLILGLHFFNRPLDAFCSAIACFFLLFVFKKNWTEILKPASVMFVCIILFCTYNWWISGHFSVSTYKIVDGEFKIFYEEADTFLNGLELFLEDYKNGLFKYLWPLLKNQYFFYMVGILPTIAIIGGVSKIKNSLVITLILHTVLLMGFYNFHATMGWPQYGARYYYPSWISLGILTAHGMKFIVNCYEFKVGYNSKLLLTFITITIVLIQAFYQVSYLKEYRGRFDFVKLYHQKLSEKCKYKDIVVFNESSWKNNVSTEFLNPVDLKRNGNGENDYFFVSNDKQLALAKKAFPEKSVCYFDFPKYKLVS